MKSLAGKISDLIRGGSLPRNVQVTKAASQPSPKAVRRGKGQGLGKGATRARNGDKN